MRLPPIPPADLSAEQRPLYDDMQAGISKGFQSFVTQREDGALLGPFNPWLHHPVAGKAMWELTKALGADSKLPGRVREVAILVVGAHFDAAYELYAHVRVAEAAGLDRPRIAAIARGERPADLTREEAAAYDVAAALCRGGGALPDALHAEAVAHWGEPGAAELAYVVGMYCLVSVTLNAFDIPAPEATGG